MARPKRQENAPNLKLKSALIYARVSTKEPSDEGYSLDAQLALLRSYAMREGMTVLEEYVESGTTKVSGRPAFTEMVKLFKSGKAPILLVEKTDRLYRDIRDYLTIDELDIEIHLVKEGEIISHESRSHQKFIHGIRVLMARNYSDNLSEETRKVFPQKLGSDFGHLTHRLATSMLKRMAAG